MSAILLQDMKDYIELHITGLKKAVEFKRATVWLIWLIQGQFCAAGWEGDMTTMLTISDTT